MQLLGNATTVAVTWDAGCSSAAPAARATMVRSQAQRTAAGNGTLQQTDRAGTGGTFFPSRRPCKARHSAPGSPACYCIVIESCPSRHKSTNQASRAVPAYQHLPPSCPRGKERDAAAAVPGWRRHPRWQQARACASPVIEYRQIPRRTASSSTEETPSTRGGVHIALWPDALAALWKTAASARLPAAGGIVAKRRGRAPTHGRRPRLAPPRMRRCRTCPASRQLPRACWARCWPPRPSDLVLL